MAKVYKVENINVDALVEEIVEIQNQYSKLEEKLKEMKAEAEAKLFKMPSSVRERLEGDKYFMEKIPVLTQKTYDVKQLKVLLEAAGVDYKEILKRTVVTKVDERKLKNLIKDDVISQTMVNKVISGNQSCRTIYGVIDK
jgi:hypothetical protein